MHFASIGQDYSVDLAADLAFDNDFVGVARDSRLKLGK
jgi:hypothetical protein